MNAVWRPLPGYVSLLRSDTGNSIVLATVAVGVMIKEQPVQFAEPRFPAPHLELKALANGQGHLAF